MDIAARDLAANSKTCAGDLFCASTAGGIAPGRPVSQWVGQIGLDFASAYYGRMNVNINGRAHSAVIERELGENYSAARNIGDSHIT